MNTMTQPEPNDTGAGPFATEQQAHAASWYARQGQSGATGAANHAQLTAACAAAGVQLGSYDEAIIAWLAGWEPATCAVIAGFITRGTAGICGNCGGEIEEEEEGKLDLDDPEALRRELIQVVHGELGTGLWGTSPRHRAYVAARAAWLAARIAWLEALATPEDCLPPGAARMGPSTATAVEEVI
jgi:hypothetical protein